MYISTIFSLFAFPIIFPLLSAQFQLDACFHEHNLEDLVWCWSQFIPQAGSLSRAEWEETLPTDQERGDWQNLIKLILSSSDTTCQLNVPSSLSEFYSVKLYKDANDDGFCILYETSLVDGRFQKGWALFVVPAKRTWTKINVHYSAAHPISDGPVHLQAAAVFQRTAGRSLLISGIRRDSTRIYSQCQNKELTTDGAHDNGTMFHSALLAIASWQLQSTRARIGKEMCTLSNCAFLQFHGKANTSCVNDSIFISTGYSDKDAIVYSNPHLPVNRLKSAWIQNAPKWWTASTPVDSHCGLAATTNIFGRYLNGVPVGEECGTRADATGASGLFIHVEQAEQAREREAYDIWTKTLVTAFSAQQSNHKSGSGEELRFVYICLILIGFFYIQNICTYCS